MFRSKAGATISSSLCLVRAFLPHSYPARSPSNRAAMFAHAVAVLTRETYEVTFMATHRPGYGNDETLVVKLDGKPVWHSRHPGDVFTTYQFAFNASATTATLRFENDSPAGDKSVFIDKVNVELSGACHTHAR